MVIRETDTRRPDQSLNLLLIEDEVTDAKWVERVLQKEKAAYQIQWAESLEAAIKALSGRAYDVIVSDLALPDAKGLEVFSEIAKRAPHTPVVLLTGNYEEKGIAIEAVRNGAQDFILKGSTDAQEFVRAIHYSIERKKLLLMRD